MRNLLVALFLLSTSFGEVIDLADFKGKNNRHSQFGEEGVIKKIFDTIGTTNKYYIDFGAGDGYHLSNTAFLRDEHSWTGLLLEGGNENPSINLHQEWITKDNICKIFEKYNVPKEFDFISIDIDGNDFYLFHAVCKEYNPRVICIETNLNYLEHDYVMPYNEHHRYDGTTYHGTTLFPICKLAEKHGYTFVHLNFINAFFIRNDIIASCSDEFKDQGKYMDVIKRTRCGYPYHNLDGAHRQYISYEKALKYCN